jgi:peptidoglycan/xylan/chitin deacetylase (PgdA/CDA1 family)
MTKKIFGQVTSGMLILAILAAGCSGRKSKDKIVVLTFDDAVQSHLDFVAPLLKEKGFGATFFITARWMDDTANFLSWEDVSVIDKMGFEIGNHTWDHASLYSDEAVQMMKDNLAKVDSALQANGVPKPVSFAYPGNEFSPGTVKKIRELGYRFARRGMQPEVPYGKMQRGPLFDPEKNNRLVIPTTADAYPEWTLDYFKRVIDRAEGGKAMILQFHGVPDIAHPWVHTDPDKFIQFMDYLETTDCKVIALRDLDKYFKIGEVDDPALGYSYGTQ